MGRTDLCLEELEGLLRARVSIYGGGWGWRRGGQRGGRAEEIGEGDIHTPFFSGKRLIFLRD